MTVALQSPVKKIFITQVFGVNPDIYGKFGLKGHNGIDLRAFLPTGERCYEGGKSEVFAPHAGKIIENALDKGYGWYVKIEDEVQGSILAHFSAQSPIKVGETVKMGQFIGFQGTTGFSTGIHLHWGYYKHPRNRSNGYGGCINQEGLYASFGGTVSETMVVPKADWEKVRNNSETLDAVTDLLKLERNSKADAVKGAIQKIIDERISAQHSAADLRTRLDNEIQAHKATVEALANRLIECEPKHNLEIDWSEWKINGLTRVVGDVHINYDRIK
jgi:hypothetical protein